MKPGSNTDWRVITPVAEWGDRSIVATRIYAGYQLTVHSNPIGPGWAWEVATLRHVHKNDGDVDYTVIQDVKTGAAKSHTAAKDAAVAAAQSLPGEVPDPTSKAVWRQEQQSTVTAREQAMKWHGDYHASQVWLETSFGGFRIRLSSWGPHAEVGRGRHSELKSWTIEFLTGDNLIAYGSTWAEVEKDITDDEAKEMALDIVDRWLTSTQRSLRAARGLL